MGEIDTALHQELATAKVSLQDFLKSRHPAWNLVGRVHFNLAENRKDPEAPFAFLATYTSRLSAQARRNTSRLSQALARIFGGEEQGALLVAAAAGAARGGDTAMASRHGGCRRDIPSAALDAA